MKTRLLAAIGLLAALSLQAQVPSKKGVSEKLLDPYYERLCESHFISIQLEGEDVHQAIISYLKENNPHFKSEFSAPVMLYDKTSPGGGRHLTFEQHFAGMPVFNSHVKVNLSQNRINSIFDNAWLTDNWGRGEVASDFAEIDEVNIAAYFRKQRSLEDEFVKTRKVIAVLENEPVALAEIELWDLKTNEHLLLLADNDYNLFLRRDLNVYFDDTVVNASGLVFIPDPLTSAQKFYGPPYIDANDSDVPELNAERKQVQISVTFDGSEYRLENPYVLIWDITAPDSTPVVSTVPVFDYTRARSGFEDVNVLYHITEFNAYVQSIGFDTLVNFQVIADPHAGTQDNSAFTPGAFGPQLTFGTGGVDDAEDSDVIVHEYGHALSHAASPYQNDGHERKSVDEGIGDFFATSYSRAIDEFRWADMFTWDGHNESESWGWYGRTAITSRNYDVPDTMVKYSIHNNGQIYNHALMLIWEQIGRQKTDMLVLKTLYQLSDGMSMKDAALLLFDADTALFNGAHYCPIFHALLQKGFVDSFGVAACKTIDKQIVVDAGANQTICNGDGVEIGNPDMSNPGYFYRWEPSTGLSNPYTLATIASPGETTTYTLTATVFDGKYNVDTITVSVQNCQVNLEIMPNHDVIVTFPFNSMDNTVELFDISGKRLMSQASIADFTYTFNIRVLPVGIYILRTKTNKGTDSLKLKKVR